MAVLRFLSFLGWLAVFAVLVVFAIKNTEPATLHFYFDRTWQAPLVFIVAVSFVRRGGVRRDRLHRADRAPAARDRAPRERAAAARAGAGRGEPPRPATVPDVPSLP